MVSNNPKKNSIFLQLSGRYYGKLCDLEDGELLATAAELFLIRPDELEGQVTRLGDGDMVVVSFEMD